EKKISWKQIFSDFKIEFEKSKKFQTTIDNQKISLESAILNDDGSIQINNKKVFSLR
ncbi:biotin--[acetyl-CoA-carboxylase] ligase, partial [Aliarcobacter butzleri]